MCTWDLRLQFLIISWYWMLWHCLQQITKRAVDKVTNVLSLQSNTCVITIAICHVDFTRYSFSYANNSDWTTTTCVGPFRPARETAVVDCTGLSLAAWGGGKGHNWHTLGAQGLHDSSLMSRPHHLNRKRVWWPFLAVSSQQSWFYLYDALATSLACSDSVGSGNIKWKGQWIVWGLG